MILGIDASNIRAGGGLTHLRQILAGAEPSGHGFAKVIVWSNHKTLDGLPDKPWLQKETHPYLNKSFAWSFIFQIFILKGMAKKSGCNLVFAPGSTFLSLFRPYVTMSQNMLPFDFHEAFRFKSPKVRLRFILLRFTQSLTFRHAAGLIFLTQYAKAAVSAKISLGKVSTTVIPHGVNMAFSNPPKAQRPMSDFTAAKPFRLLYVSIVTAYKHQWNVAAAVLELRRQGFPVAIDFIGPDSGESSDKLKKYLNSPENTDGALRYLGAVPYDELAAIYKNADAFVFASSCENLPIILIEAMSAGLPIACSSKGPMPEVLGDAGAYFDPEDMASISDALKTLCLDASLRQSFAVKAYEKVIYYTWENCADRTFGFLSEIAQKQRRPH